MRLLMMAIFFLAVSQQDRVEARDLGVCNGLNFKACAEALFRSDKKFWIKLCGENEIDSPNECVAEMVSCLSDHPPADLKKHKNEQSVLQSENADEDDIGMEISLCLEGA